LVHILEQEGRGGVKAGLALCASDGLVLGRGMLNSQLFKAITKVQVEDPVSTTFKGLLGND